MRGLDRAQVVFLGHSSSHWQAQKLQNHGALLKVLFEKVVWLVEVEEVWTFAADGKVGSALECAAEDRELSGRAPPGTGSATTTAMKTWSREQRLKQSEIRAEQNFSKHKDCCDARKRGGG